jgi:DNA-binding beta-propeller fold protein YncE
MVRKLIGNRVGVSGIYESDDNVSLVKNTADLSRYVYNTQSNLNIPGVAAISDLYISPDETRLYLSDSTTDRIHQFSLSGFGITCDFNLKSAYVGSQDGTAQGVTIGAAGTAMYIVGSTNDSIYQYTLSTAYDVSTASYSGISSSIAARETEPRDLIFSDDGTKVYVVGNTAAGAGVIAGLEYVHQFNLGTAWNVGTAGYSTSFNVTAQTGTNPTGLYIGVGGTAMYVTTNSAIFQYTLGTPWEVNTASYANKSLAVSTQEGTTNALYFKPDGTKVYVVGNSNDTIFQYSVNTPWDISTGSYDTKYFYIGAQELTPTGLYFSPDGTKVFIVGSANNIVYQYSLITPWDISTVDFTPSAFVGNLEASPQSLYIKPDGTAAYVLGDTSDRVWTLPLTTPWDIKTAPILNSFPVGSQDALPQGVTIGAAGTAMYIVGSTNDTIYQYTLGTAYDVSTASYSGISSSIAARETVPTDLTFSDDGTKVYVIGETAAGAGVTAGLEYVHQFNLGTAWNVGTAGYFTSFNVTAQTGISPTGLTIGAGGTAMYVVSSTNDAIYQYTLETPWEVNTASYANKSLAVNGQQEATASALYFKSDGTKVYILGTTNDTIYQYTLGTAWDISTVVQPYSGKNFSVSQDATPSGVFIGAAGTVMYISGATSNTIYQYTLGTAYDVSTASYSGISSNISAREASLQDLTFSDDGTKVFVVGLQAAGAGVTAGAEYVHQFNLGTAWNVGTAGYSTSFYVTPQTSILPSGLTIGAAGTALYVNNSSTIYQYTLATPWEVNTASYTNKSLAVNGQEATASALYFKSDGTKVYIVGINNDTIYQYSLGTAWDVSTGSYDGKTLYVGTQEATARGLYFSPDGTQVYIVGDTNDRVYQYNLEIPWELGEYTRTLHIGTQETLPTGLYFNPTGTKVYVVGTNSDRVFEYPLITAWDITSSVNSFNLTDATPTAFYFKPDGTKFYIVGQTGDVIYQYSLSRPWDVTSASYDSKSFNIGGEELTPTGLYFNTNGTKVYIVGSTSDRVFVYSLRTAWDISTAISPYNIKGFSVTVQDGTPQGVTIGAAGTSMYIIGSNNDTIYQYTLGTAYDVSTAFYYGISSNISARESVPQDLTFSDDGTKVYVLGQTAAGAGLTANGEYVHQFNLGTAWNISTAGYSTSFYVTTQTSTAPTGLYIGAGGTAMYVLGETNDAIYQYTLATPWEVNTASYANKSFSVITQETAISALYFKSDGTKVYILGTNNDRIFQYNLSTPWDIITASYDNKFLFVGAQEATARGLYFSPDGTRVFIVGDTSDTVFSYDLEVPWDLSFTFKSLYVGVEEATPSGIALSNNLDKLYIVGTGTRALRQYDLLN